MQYLIAFIVFGHGFVCIRIGSMLPFVYRWYVHPHPHVEHLAPQWYQPYSRDTDRAC